MGLTMSDDGGLELFVEFFVAAASLALTSSSFAVVSSSLRVVWSSCLTTASNFRSNSLKRCSHRSQSGHPFPVLMDDDSTRNRRILEHRFQAVNSYRLRNTLPSATTALECHTSWSPAKTSCMTERVRPCCMDTAALKSRYNRVTTRASGVHGPVKAASMWWRTSVVEVSMDRAGTARRCKKIACVPTKILLRLRRTCTPAKFLRQNDWEFREAPTAAYWWETWWLSTQS